MRITVMCGGKGTRLGQPIKCLTEVAGRPFMDWKLNQLYRQGFRQITLAVGPYFLPYWERYGNKVAYICDRQEGIRAVAESLPHPTWWCNGDTLLEIPKEQRHILPTVTTPTALATNYLVEPPNVEGGWLDAGYYYGLPPYEWRLVEVRPHHLNTPADWAETDLYVRRVLRHWELEDAYLG